ncbi:ankyrin repeat domain-containing protein [Pseudoxanthomonas winnipegensis]|uniref:Ankyrin repeat domain-containing protein n=1 Tax=Pseudoxanthomonas winnipegensis TaxID=2480810 RepID=A0A4V6ML01_9GAMM|nr:ankyrin repeat domain-containing protein [Pseudoxanthomonas winnipegensis]TAA41546.1 ankyrin repeat domain-containing protein [Pseudoxanthomonas winnipegensis]
MGIFQQIKDILTGQNKPTEKERLLEWIDDIPWREQRKNPPTDDRTLITRALKRAISTDCDVEDIEKLVGMGYHVDDVPEGEPTPLIIAVQKNEPHYVKKFLKLGADPCAQDNEALYLALISQHYFAPEIIDDLLRAGANANSNFDNKDLPASIGMTPLALAMRKPKIFTDLVRRGGNVQQAFEWIAPYLLDQSKSIDTQNLRLCYLLSQMRALDIPLNILVTVESMRAILEVWPDPDKPIACGKSLLDIQKIWRYPFASSNDELQVQEIIEAAQARCMGERIQTAVDAEGMQNQTKKRRM